MQNQPIHRRLLAALMLFCLMSVAPPAGAGELKLVDAHIHYSHDAWKLVPPRAAIATLRKAGIRRAFVSSSPDAGTQKLYRLAPEMIVPVLRPYRKRGELGTWMYDPSVIPMLQEKLRQNRYAGIGEFHVSGERADLPVLRQLVALAYEQGVFLHAHSDAEAVRRMFAQNPEVIILWAHSGFEELDEVRQMLQSYPNLYADLAFRSEHDLGGRVDPDWLALFQAFPARFMLGTDTYEPGRWQSVVAEAEQNRSWLAALPDALARKLAFENAERLADRVLKPGAGLLTE